MGLFMVFVPLGFLFLLLFLLCYKGVNLLLVLLYEDLVDLLDPVDGYLSLDFLAKILPVLHLCGKGSIG